MNSNSNPFLIQLSLIVIDRVWDSRQEYVLCELLLLNFQIKIYLFRIHKIASAEFGDLKRKTPPAPQCPPP